MEITMPPQEKIKRPNRIKVNEDRKKALNYSQRIKSVDSSVITSENLAQFKEDVE